MTDKPKELGIPWKPGQSGNPGGRPKMVKEVVELARSATELAIKTLIEIAGKSNAPESARVAASNALLDRGWGKPVQAMEHSGPGGSELPGIVVTYVRSDNGTVPASPGVPV